MLALRKRLWMEDGSVLVDGHWPLQGNPRAGVVNPLLGPMLPDFHIPIAYSGEDGGFAGALMLEPGTKVYASIEVVELPDDEEAADAGS